MLKFFDTVLFIYKCNRPLSNKKSIVNGKVCRRIRHRMKCDGIAKYIFALHN